MQIGQAGGVRVEDRVSGEAARVGPSLERLMLAEQSHRTANDIGVAMSVLHLAATRPGEAAGRLDEALKRLRAVATVQRLLIPPVESRPVDAKALLEGICANVSAYRLEPAGIGMHVAVDDFTLEADAAWMLGAIVFELVTNAARHAFKGRGGRVAVTMRDIAGALVLTVSDDGIGSRLPPSAPATPCRDQTGVGTVVVDALAEGLGTRLQRSPSESGTTVSMALKLLPAAARTGPRPVAELALSGPS